MKAAASQKVVAFLHFEMDAGNFRQTIPVKSQGLLIVIFKSLVSLLVSSFTIDPMVFSCVRMQIRLYLLLVCCWNSKVNLF